jgi:hypothetical protein
MLQCFSWTAKALRIFIRGVFIFRVPGKSETLAAKKHWSLPSCAQMLYSVV